MSYQVTFLGTGGFSTALAIHLSRQNNQVTIWGRDPEYCQHLSASRVNDRHLPGIPIPREIRITGSIADSMAGSDLIVAGIPTAYLRSTLSHIASYIPACQPVLSLVKGLEFQTLARPTQIVNEILGQRPVAVLSGPSHAEELAQGRPTSMVVASSDKALAELACCIFNSGSLRVYRNEDSIGVELAGALKNIMGLAAGLCDGLGFGDNAKAAMLTRGLVEMTRFALPRGAKTTTFFGLAGIGDLMTTCFSPHGRNRALGIKMAQGLTLEQAQNSTTNVAEGVFTTFSVAQAARELGIDMPITAAVEKILMGQSTPRSAVAELLSRPTGAESFEIGP
ncbi:MAG: NAD(P)-dependent glycerol-3-phosphate dehydrogenase [Planctomycetota bacterium]|nr:NAD(P)-dependent glycerol-3-phosphate dehydrogenase [Planctomycetota bacterium]